MTIEFDDGSMIDAGDWDRIRRILAEKARRNRDGVDEPKVDKITSRDGVTIKVGNLALKKNAKMPLARPNYIEGKYKDWTIRVWRQEDEEIYGCNYFLGQDVRYFELTFSEARDENYVFKMAKALIEEAISG